MARLRYILRMAASQCHQELLTDIHVHNLSHTRIGMGLMNKYKLLLVTNLRADFAQIS